MKRKVPGAVILAAGLGSRLGALAAHGPKAMIRIGGMSVLERAIRSLEAARVPKITIVTGHRHAVIDAFVARGTFAAEVRTVHNPAYATANNIVSFMVAARELRDGGILLNSDVIFDPSILRDVLCAGAGTWLVVDDTHPLDEEDMKVELNDRGRIVRISKRLDRDSAHGEYIGLALLDAAGARAALAAAQALVDDDGSALYYEDAFDQCAARVNFRPLSTRGAAWTEIDDAADYERAVKIAAGLAAAEPA